MSNPVTETKIELVTESIEALVLASVIAATNLSVGDRALNHQNVLDAREVLKGSLREFLQPALRIVSIEREETVGPISRTLRRTVTEDTREVVPYGGLGIDGMNLA